MVAGDVFWVRCGDDGGVAGGVDFGQNVNATLRARFVKDESGI